MNLKTVCKINIHETNVYYALGSRIITRSVNRWVERFGEDVQNRITLLLRMISE